MSRSRGILIALVMECSLSGAVCAQPRGQIDNEKARYLLGEMLASRKNMRNLQFEVEYTDWRDRNLAKSQYDELANRLKGLTTRQLEQLREGMLKGGNETSYQVQSIVVDSSDREKIQQTQNGIVDSSGRKLPTGATIGIWTWDGRVGVSYTRGEKGGSAILEDSPPNPLKHQRQPWRSFTAAFADRLAEAIEAEKPINVETLPDGKYRASFINSLGNETIAGIDPERGFSCTSLTTRRDGIDQGYCTAEYEEFADGVWFPVRGEDVGVSRKGGVIYRGTMKTSNVKINDPNFHENLFHVDLPKGTKVRDIVSGIEYVVGDPKSVRADGDGVSLHQVTMETLEEMAKEIDQEHQDAELFVPKVGIALEKGRSFVLGLADGKLVNPGNKPESPESDNFLTELGRGDIAWDDALVATRGAKVLTLKQESKRPLKLTKGKWTGSYELPDKVELPYSMLVVTNEDVSYFMTVRKIDSGGITIAYRKLDPDEVDQYKQEPEDR